jgi:hypothetical protein
MLRTDGRRHDPQPSVSDREAPDVPASATRAEEPLMAAFDDDEFWSLDEEWPHQFGAAHLGIP